MKCLCVSGCVCVSILFLHSVLICALTTPVPDAGLTSLLKPSPYRTDVPAVLEVLRRLVLL